LVNQAAARRDRSRSASKGAVPVNTAHPSRNGTSQEADAHLFFQNIGQSLPAGENRGESELLDYAAVLFQGGQKVPEKGRLGKIFPRLRQEGRRRFLSSGGKSWFLAFTFTPTPMSISTCMYYTGMDPKTKKKIYVPYTYHEKKEQKRIAMKAMKSDKKCD
jgi:hypothetical protein